MHLGRLRAGVACHPLHTKASQVARRSRPHRSSTTLPQRIPAGTTATGTSTGASGGSALQRLSASAKEAKEELKHEIQVGAFFVQWFHLFSHELGPLG